MGWRERFRESQETELTTDLQTDQIWGGPSAGHYRLVYRFLEMQEKPGFHVGMGGEDGW